MSELRVQKDGGFAYSIIIEDSFSLLESEIQRLGKKPNKICIVTDSNVATLYLENVESVLKKIFPNVVSYILPAGEKNKTLDQIQDIYTYLIEQRFERTDFLAALGGGVVGDMTGYAAATYLRGIDFIQIPTTLLAQVDSSIGGKTGVDFLQYKNMVGAFHQPKLVYINVCTLKTLSDEELSCGMGEVLKHGLIRDYPYYAWVNFHRQNILKREISILMKMIYKSCLIKKTVVENDPLEKGERAVLNMGHTVGHAIEKLKNFTLLHGQCVALGMVSSLAISFWRGYITNDEFEQLQKDFKAFGLPVRVKGLKAEDIMETMKTDKKMAHGKIKFVLLENLGYAIIDNTVTDNELLDAITVIEKPE